ncbi:helix-turn-helix domain-containing protein [Mesorhizobium opportunistum]|uniref:Transcriptional regulator, AraC family n=1 Tax=Mesorhizobium opportunistum (strain LMG 24607 / HAMBI 3007 / WSM2075) TaxID=536019 RepID=F7YFN2_MESOW|nr:AraC family transcriptional regulator [Mesorhizobium opportunistum]AEH86837.1 transcriptional regulator, AraC family [Mesorhizobium opportunistum WSM2075]
MVLNVPRVDIATVPIGLPPNAGKLAVKAVACSRLIAADIRYGLTPTSHQPQFPSWDDAFSIGVRLKDETSDIHVDGRNYAHPRRNGETHVLYLSGVEHIDFSTPRHTIETLLPRSFMREIADDLEVPHVTYLGRSAFHVTADPVLRHLTLRTQPFFAAPETLDPLLADHFMWSLGIYVCAHYGDLGIRRRITGGLNTWQERLAKEVIETSLVGGIGLAELAGLCGLGTSQFAHAFRKSTGMAPYQWLVKRRVERAREMLAGTASLADVALMSGFADQSHLTRVFSRHMGLTPGKLRACLQ